jgi:hypothetical protein
MFDTLEEAVESLAQFAAECQSHQVPFGEKRAVGLSDYLSSFGQYAKDNPWLSHGLLGGALGAGVGGVSAALGNRGVEPSERRSVLSSALTGGLAGAAIGGGIGAGRQALRSLTSGEGQGNVMSAGEFVDPITNEKVRLNPAAVHANPQDAKRIRELTAKESPWEKGINDTLSGATNLAARTVPGLRSVLGRLGVPGMEGKTIFDKYAPLSATWVPRLAGIDIAAHMPGLNLGQRIGWGRIPPEASRNVQNLMRGLETSYGKALPEPIRKAIMEGTHDPGMAANVTRSMPESNMPGQPGSFVPGAGKGTGGRIADILGKRDATSRPFGERVRELVAKIRGKPYIEDPVLRTFYRPEGREETVRGVSTERGGIKDVKQKTVEPVKEAPSLSRSQLQMLKRLGYEEAESAAKHSPPRSLFRGLAGERPFSAPGGAGIKRVLGYGAIPLFEYLSGVSQSQEARDQELRSLVSRNAMPAGGK